MTKTLTPTEAAQINARARYVRRANIPDVPRTRPLTDFPAAWTEPCQTFIDQCMLSGADLPGVGLLLHGDPGTGKTTLALSVLLEVLVQAPRKWLGDSRYHADHPGYFIPHTEFIDLHHNSWRDDETAEDARELLRTLYCRNPEPWQNTRVAVLDDAGKENPRVGTGHKSQVMHDVLRARYSKGSPTIVTTNLQVSEWDSQYGPATSSFLNEAFQHVHIDGPDKRKPRGHDS